MKFNKKNNINKILKILLKIKKKHYKYHNMKLIFINLIKILLKKKFYLKIHIKKKKN